MFQAYAYTAALHYLRAVQAAGTDDGPTMRWSSARAGA